MKRSSLSVPPIIGAALVRVLRADVRLSRCKDPWSRALRVALREARKDILEAYRRGEKNQCMAALDLRAAAAHCEAELVLQSDRSAA
jgi:hypothetical protein